MIVSVESICSVGVSRSVLTKYYFMCKLRCIRFYLVGNWGMLDSTTVRPNYSNPRCACAPRVKNAAHLSHIHAYLNSCLNQQIHDTIALFRQCFIFTLNECSYCCQ